MLDECWHGCGSYGAVWSCGRCVGTKTHAAITSAMATSSPEDSDLYFVVYGVDYDTNKTDELGQAFVNLEQLYAGGRDLFKEMVPVQDTSGKLLGKLSVTLEAMDAMRSIERQSSPKDVIRVKFAEFAVDVEKIPPIYERMWIGFDFLGIEGLTEMKSEEREVFEDGVDPFVFDCKFDCTPGGLVVCGGESRAVKCELWRVFVEEMWWCAVLRCVHVQVLTTILSSCCSTLTLAIVPWSLLM